VASARDAAALRSTVVAEVAADAKTLESSGAAHAMQSNQIISWFRALVGSLIGLVLLSALVACGGGASSGTAQPAPDSPPPAPTGAATATLAWSDSSGASIAGYRVYYGVASGTYLQPKGSGIDVGRVATHVISGLGAGQQYFFAVTAFDAQGNESDYSAEASKLVQ
jgi:Fibronectin type III domain